MNTWNRWVHSCGRWVSLGVVCIGAFLIAQACTQREAPTAPTQLANIGETGHGSHAAVDQEASSTESMLAVVRQATAKYHDVSVALADGYQLGFRGVVTGCVAQPGVGAMGYHYFNWKKMDDPSIVEDDPEVLVYHTGDDGTLVLGAVEWVVPKVAWEAAGNVAPPVVFGQNLHVLNPVLNWYIEHAWVWTENPSGIFTDWNPKVLCP